ncbi:MAG: hypothetical protein ACXVAX_00455 [Pseudobdellovibrio sp.]
MNFRNGLFITASALIMCSCQNGGSSPSTDTTAAKDYTAIALALAPSVTYTIPGDLNGDCYFNTQVVTSGSTVVAYNSSSVPAGQSCTSEVRTCESGMLTGSFNYASCSVNAPASCLFNGQTIADGQSVTAYTNSSVPYGDTCASEVRTCTNGVLSGSNQYGSCNVDAAASCLFNGVTVASGASVSAYLASSVSYGSSCQLEYRTCDNGVLSGSNQYASCNVDAAASCLFNGQTVADGQTVTAFLSASVDAGSSCSSEVRTCNNGVLSGSDQYASCTVNQPASCLFNGQTLANGQTVTAFESSSVEYGQLCNAETRVCDNGHLSGSFTYGSCDAGQPVSCLFNGQTIPSGATVTAYATSSVAVGATCQSEVRTCSNGVLSGSNQYGTCEVAQPKACLFNGKTISSGDSVVAYQTTKCDNRGKCQSEVRTCSNGVLSGSYTSSTCKNKDYKPLHDDDDTVKICKLVVQIKHAEILSKKGVDENSSFSVPGNCQLKERFNCGLHLGWYKQENRDEHPTCKSIKGWYEDKPKNPAQSHH